MDSVSFLHVLNHERWAKVPAACASTLQRNIACKSLLQVLRHHIITPSTRNTALLDINHILKDDSFSSCWPACVVFAIRPGRLWSIGRRPAFRCFRQCVKFVPVDCERRHMTCCCDDIRLTRRATGKIPNWRYYYVTRRRASPQASEREWPMMHDVIKVVFEADRRVWVLVCLCSCVRSDGTSAMDTQHHMISVQSMRLNTPHMHKRQLHKSCNCKCTCMC